MAQPKTHQLPIQNPRQKYIPFLELRITPIIIINRWNVWPCLACLERQVQIFQEYENRPLLTNLKKNNYPSFKIYNIHQSSGNIEGSSNIFHPSPPSQPLPSSTPGSSPWWFLGADNWQLLSVLFFCTSQNGHLLKLLKTNCCWNLMTFWLLEFLFGKWMPVFVLCLRVSEFVFFTWLKWHKWRANLEYVWN